MRDLFEKGKSYNKQISFAEENLQLLEDKVTN